MLKYFSVKNFKQFSDMLEFDFSDVGSYEFNTECVRDGLLNKSIVYGFNGSGKTSLGLAIFDISTHITNRERNEQSYMPYCNLNFAPDSCAEFEYKFLFSGTELSYKYAKTDLNTLLSESLTIDGKEVLNYDFKNHKGFVKLKGAETLRLDSEESAISRVKFVSTNAILAQDPVNLVFNSFIRFVDKMLMFYSLDTRSYQGFTNGTEDIGTGIIEAGKVSEFEAFLRSNNIDMELGEDVFEGRRILMAKYRYGWSNFFHIASTGTRSLALFYYWLLRMSKASFVFMDEFDAFYHFELAKNVVEEVKKLQNTQLVLTTHNTDLLSNDILRPDCYLWLDNNSLKPLCRLTSKELRKAHNLQKMFKAGAFYEG